MASLDAYGSARETGTAASDASDAERQLAEVADRVRRYAARFRLVMILIVFGAMGIVGGVVGLQIGIHSLSDDATAFVWLAIVAGPAAGFGYLVPRVLRSRLSFYRGLLPLARGYTYRPFGRITSVLTNDLVVSDFTGGRSSPAGVVCEAVLAADGSPLPPDLSQLPGLGRPRPPTGQIRGIHVVPDPRIADARLLARQLGSTYARTRVSGLRNSPSGSGPQLRYRATVWFFDNAWDRKASRFGQNSAAILELLKGLAAGQTLG